MILKIKSLTILWIGIISAICVSAQTKTDTTNNSEIFNKDSARKFFGVYEINSGFRLKFFSGTADKVFAERVGELQKFQAVPKSSNSFILKAISAELEFVNSWNGKYDILIIRQNGKEMKGNRISYEPYELYDTIMRLDQEFYSAYNNRELQKFMSYLSPDLEFYHDITGLTDYKTNLDVFRKKISDTSLIMRRELVPATLKVIPVKDFGAIEMGTHQFFIVNKTKGDRLAAQTRFVHIWKKTAGKWKIFRVISWDHEISE